MEIIVQAKACTQRGSKPIFRVWSTSGLLSGSILWQFDFYTKPFFWVWDTGGLLTGSILWHFHFDNNNNYYF
jgi:hypothetical protein